MFIGIQITLYHSVNKDLKPNRYVPIPCFPEICLSECAIPSMLVVTHILLWSSDIGGEHSFDLTSLGLLYLFFLLCFALTNAFLASSNDLIRQWLTNRLIIMRIVLYFETGGNTSVKSIPGICKNSFAIKHSLF